MSLIKSLLLNSIDGIEFQFAIILFGQLKFGVVSLGILTQTLETVVWVVENEKHQDG